MSVDEPDLMVVLERDPNGGVAGGRSAAARRLAVAMRGRAIWTLSDQALSSLTNAVLAIVVARVVDRTAFGSFSIALVTFSFVVGISRAAVADPLVIRFSASDGARRRRAIRQASGAAAAIGLLAGVVCLLVAVFALGAETRSGLIALAVMFPGVLVQDTWRFGFFAAARPAAACINDLVWAVVQFTAIGLLIAAGNHSVFWITLAWSGAAAVAAVFGCFQLGMLPDPSAALAWLRSTRELNVRMALDYVFNMGAVNGATFVIGAVVGVAAVGALRAAQVLLGPLQLVFSSVSSFVLPIFVRRAVAGRRIVGAGLLASAATSVVLWTWVLVLVLLPDSLGRELLGDSWTGAHHVMLASGASMGAVAAAIGASLGLKALRRADLLLRVTLVQAPLIIGLGTVLGITGGVLGAAVGFAIAQVVGAVLSWLCFTAAQRQEDAEHRLWEPVPA